MYSFYIDGSDIKIFMNCLLKEETFKGFDLRSCEIKKNVFISIDGKLNKKWYDEEIEKDYISWEKIKPAVFEHIKGKKTPESMKLVLSVSNPDKIHSNAKACFLNILYEEDKVAVVTGTAQKEFSMDKSLDDVWEDNIKRFFKKMKIVQNIEI